MPVLDPDAPAERPPFSFVGKLTASILVEDASQCPEEVRDAYETYTASLTQPMPIWVLIAEARYTDGTPAYRHEFIRIKPPIYKGSTPDLLAQQFLSLGYSASWTKVGTPQSAVGRVFKFEEHTEELGRGFSKTFRLWPVSEAHEDDITEFTASSATVDVPTPTANEAPPEVLSAVKDLVASGLSPVAAVLKAGAANYTVQGTPILELASSGALVELL